jgi:hypothetical protein
MPLPRRLKRERLSPSGRPSCATASGGGALGLLPNPEAPVSLIEIQLMDRETARKNMSAGLLAGGLAATVFALCFLAAFLYIAQ